MTGAHTPGSRARRYRPRDDSVAFGMPKYRAVLFDLDGTLIDSVRLILDSYHHTLQVHGLPPQTDEHWLAGLGTPLWAQFAAYVDTPELMDAMVATYREYNIANHDAQVTVYPGVLDTVASIQAAGIPMGLVTSKTRVGAFRGLRLMGMEEAMAVVVGADDVERHKPDPLPVQRALETLGVEASETIFVGDSRHDMVSGRAAGTATGGVLWGPFDRAHLEPTGPDHWLERPQDLLTVLEL